ncbi:MAG: pyrroline-5-carboxylate reductase [Methylophilus sp.]|nr:pyrroline-5-carboxylate reductase [Methylophilus sp.]
MNPPYHYTIGFIGGGNMATALIVGLKHQGFDAANILVVELDEAKRADLTTRLGVKTTQHLNAIAQYDVIVLAIKPQQLKALAVELAPLLNTQLVISIAAGIRANDLSRWLGAYSSLIRAMPNTPAQIQAGITGLYAMQKVTEAQKSIATQILNTAGDTLWLNDEQALDAVTAISGSGPAYVFYLIEALQAAAIQLGLSAEQAKTLSIKTFKGASLLADMSTTPVNILREQVTSRGGTTEQGLLSLESLKVKQAIIQAAQAAEKRAKILGDQLGSE